MSEGYRIPSIEEFVQGFKFQVEVTHTFGFIFGGETSHTSRTSWEDVEVWWKHPDKELITETTEDGGTITVTGGFMNFFAPYSDKQVEQLLSEGKIRVKI